LGELVKIFPPLAKKKRVSDLVVIVYRNLVSLKGSNKASYYYLLLYYNSSMQKSTDNRNVNIYLE